MEHYTLDRFEGDYAVVETPDCSTVDVLRAELPADAVEGSFLLRTEDGWQLTDSPDTARRIRQKFEHLLHPEG